MELRTTGCVICAELKLYFLEWPFSQIQQNNVCSRVVREL